MKAVEIFGEPVFWFEVTRPEVDLLLELAKHASGVCPGAERFLYGWRNGFRMHPPSEPDPETSKGRATERDVQILMKILEARHVYLISKSSELKELAEDLTRQLYRAWRHANKTAKTWTTQVTWFSTEETDAEKD